MTYQGWTQPPSLRTTPTYNPVDELVTISVWAMGAPSPSNTATWTYDAAGNQTGNSGYPGVSNPLTITYNAHNQTTSITDVYQHPVAMTYNGPGQSERTSADWSNQPSGSTPEYGHTTYANSALGLMSKTDTTGTTYDAKDPGGVPLGERTPTGTHYNIFDGQGSLVMLVDGANGSPVDIKYSCPTGNKAGGDWQAPGTNARDQNILGSGAVAGATIDAGTQQLRSGDMIFDTSSGVGTQSCTQGGFICVPRVITMPKRKEVTVPPPCPHPEDTLGAENAYFGKVLLLVRGPEFDAVYACHVNVQTKPGRNFHVFYREGQFETDLIPWLGGDLYSAASDISTLQAALIAVEGWVSPQGPYDWLMGEPSYLPTRLQQLIP